MVKQKTSGLSADELFERGIALTFDDFSIKDTIFSDIDKQEINLESNIGRDVVLKMPIIASPMDKVSNATSLIAIAYNGGIGCVHNNYTNPDGSPDLKTPANIVKIVKREKNGFIDKPVVVAPYQTIEDAINLGLDSTINKSRIRTFPVTARGSSNDKFVGFLRRQDYSRSSYLETKVGERMLPAEKVITGEYGISLEQANDILWQHHLTHLPIIDKHGKLKGLVTSSDIDKNAQYPFATKDNNKRLRVLFAADTFASSGHELVERCFDAGADGVIVDSSRGNTRYVVDMVKWIRKHYSEKLIIAGNVGSTEGCKKLIKAGADTLRVGQASGSICSTHEATALYAPQAATVYECSQEGYNVIGDGGYRTAGDISKGLIVGANAIMLGSLLAGTDEAPGELISHPKTGEWVKEYRGMGSMEANMGKRRGYGDRLPQGKSGFVPYRGPLQKHLNALMDGVTESFNDINCRNLQEAHSQLNNGIIRFNRHTLGAIKESGIHDLL